MNCQSNLVNHWGLQHSVRRVLAMLGLAIVITGLGLLTGCATSRMIDSDVKSFGGTAPARTNASFAIEHLPSQANGVYGITQEQLDTALVQAMETVGLHLAGQGQQADYVAQLQVRIDTIENPHYRPRYGSWLRGKDDELFIGSSALSLEPPWYRHQIQILLRDTKSNSVAYETQATFEGPWRDTDKLLPAILQAALSSYPNASQGKVVVELSPTNTTTTTKP